MQKGTKERDSVLECSGPLELSVGQRTCESAGGPAQSKDAVANLHPLVSLSLHRAKTSAAWSRLCNVGTKKGGDEPAL